MSEMVERVARAICVAQTQGDEVWQAFLPEATAAITALREPTDAMTAAGLAAIDDNLGVDGYPTRGAVETGYRAMIDAALPPPPPSA